MAGSMGKWLTNVFVLGMVVALSSLLFLVIFFSFSRVDAVLTIAMVLVCMVVQCTALAGVRFVKNARFWPGAFMLLAAVLTAWCGFAGPATVYGMPAEFLSDLREGVITTPLYLIMLPLPIAGVLDGLAYLVLGGLSLFEDLRPLLGLPPKKTAAENGEVNAAPAEDAPAGNMADTQVLVAKMADADGGAGDSEAAKAEGEPEETPAEEPAAEDPPEGPVDEDKADPAPGSAEEASAEDSPEAGPDEEEGTEADEDTQDEDTQGEDMQDGEASGEEEAEAKESSVEEPTGEPAEAPAEASEPESLPEGEDEADEPAADDDDAAGDGEDGADSVADSIAEDSDVFSRASDEFDDLDKTAALFLEDEGMPEGAAVGAATVGAAALVLSAQAAPGENGDTEEPPSPVEGDGTPPEEDTAPGGEDISGEEESPAEAGLFPEAADEAAEDEETAPAPEPAQDAGIASEDDVAKASALHSAAAALSVELRTERLRVIRLNRDALFALSTSMEDMERKVGLPVSGKALEDATRSAFTAIYQRAISDMANFKWSTIWLIVSLESGQMLGSTGFKGAPVGGAVEMTCTIHEAFRQNGYATEAAREMLAWALMQPRVTAVTARTGKQNAAASQLVQKLGFALSGGNLSSTFWVLEKAASST